MCMCFVISYCVKANEERHHEEMRVMMASTDNVCSGGAENKSYSLESAQTIFIFLIDFSPRVRGGARGSGIYI